MQVLSLQTVVSDPKSLLDPTNGLPAVDLSGRKIGGVLAIAVVELVIPEKEPDGEVGEGDELGKGGRRVPGAGEEGEVGALELGEEGGIGGDDARDEVSGARCHENSFHMVIVKVGL